MRIETSKNIAWGILGGWVAFGYMVVMGILYGITIIGIKKAWMCFRFALFMLAPFGKNVAVSFKSHKFGNTFWIFTTGWQISFFCVLLSGFFYATYFGRFLGARWFHLAQFVIAPFGSSIKHNTLLTGNESAVPFVKSENDFDLSK